MWRKLGYWQARMMCSSRISQVRNLWLFLNRTRRSSAQDRSSWLSQIITFSPKASGIAWPAALCGGALASSIFVLARTKLPAEGARCEPLVPNRLLFEAALAGNFSEVEVYIDGGGQPDGYLDENGVSALIGASNNGHLEVVRLLLIHGANPDLQAPKGSSALMVASGEGHADVVRLLLDQGAKSDLTNKNGVTALMWASTKGHHHAVCALLEGGAQVDLQDRSGISSLMAASVLGHSEVVRTLLDKGARVNLRDRAGRTALDFAQRDPVSRLEKSKTTAKGAVARILRAHGGKTSSEL